MLLCTHFFKSVPGERSSRIALMNSSEMNSKYIKLSSLKSTHYSCSWHMPFSVAEILWRLDSSQTLAQRSAPETPSCLQKVIFLAAQAD